MNVAIIKVNDRHYTVNGKVAQKDMNDNWIAIEELTPSEAKEFQKHLRSTETKTSNFKFLNKKFIVTFDPLGWTGKGQFLIKVDNDALTPFASVFVGIGIDPEKARGYAKANAERIAACLNHCKNIELE